MNTAAIAALITSVTMLISAVTTLIIAVNRLRNNPANQPVNGVKQSFLSTLKGLFGPVSTPL